MDGGNCCFLVLFHFPVPSLYGLMGALPSGKRGISERSATLRHWAGLRKTTERYPFFFLYIITMAVLDCIDSLTPMAAGEQFENNGNEIPCTSLSSYQQSALPWCLIWIPHDLQFCVRLLLVGEPLPKDRDDPCHLAPVELEKKPLAGGLAKFAAWCWLSLPIRSKKGDGAGKRALALLRRRARWTTRTGRQTVEHCCRPPDEIAAGFCFLLLLLLLFLFLPLDFAFGFSFFASTVLLLTSNAPLLKACRMTGLKRRVG